MSAIVYVSFFLFGLLTSYISYIRVFFLVFVAVPSLIDTDGCRLWVENRDWAHLPTGEEQPIANLT